MWFERSTCETFPTDDHMITTGVAKILAFWFISFSLEYLIQTLFLHPVSVSSSNKKFWLFAILMTDGSCTTSRVLVRGILVVVILFIFIPSSISWWRIISRTYLWWTKSKLAWNSSDCFESLSPLNNDVTEGGITTQSNQMKFRLKVSLLLHKL